jgi:transcriptional regulator with XRE-family HTH domain
MKNQGYNSGHRITLQDATMPKQNIEELTDFGKRLVRLRKEAGYTQVDLAKELGVSQRMISYYEGHSEYPPASVLPKLANVLNVSADELLGIQPVKKTRKPDSRLQRRMQQIEKMGSSEKRQIMQLLDAFIEREQLKQKANHGRVAARG